MEFKMLRADPITEIRRVIADVSYKPGWTVEIREMLDALTQTSNVLIRWEWKCRDVNDSHEMQCGGRWWFIEEFATPHDILRTLRLAAIQCETHEVDEMLLYDGQRIFDPHRWC